MNAPIDPALLANPLLAPWNTPYGLPPFARVTTGFCSHDRPMKGGRRLTSFRIVQILA